MIISVASYILHLITISKTTRKKKKLHVPIRKQEKKPLNSVMQPNMMKKDTLISQLLIKMLTLNKVWKKRK